MNKIICDVCGSSYPDSANQCPICGHVRPANAVAGEEATSESGTPNKENYTYVKGGRFSKKNVKKRNKQMHQVTQQEDIPEEPVDEEQKGDSSKGLIIAIIVLLIAVLAVAAYITIQFFLPLAGQSGNVVTTQPTTVETTEATTVETTVETTLPDILCTELSLNATEIILKQKDETFALVAATTPEDTTDVITFSSADEAIATVTPEGTITATGVGETVITVTCGEVSTQCKVLCSYDAETGKAFAAPYKLNKKNVTIAYKNNEKFTLKFVDANGTIIPVNYVVENPEVCSMEGNTVTALAKGKTNITVNYNGETYTCVVAVVYQH